jgi:hypothetical protein
MSDFSAMTITVLAQNQPAPGVNATTIRFCGYQELRRNSDHNFGAKSRYHHILQQLRFF